MDGRATCSQANIINQFYWLDYNIEVDNLQTSKDKSEIMSTLYEINNKVQGLSPLVSMILAQSPN